MKNLFTHVCLFALLFACLPQQSAQADNPRMVVAHHHQHGLSYVANQGQWHADVLYRADLGGLDAVFLSPQHFTFTYFNPADVAQLHELSQASLEQKNAFKLHGHTYKVRFVDAQTPKAQAYGQHRDYNNYFVGNDPSRWKGHVPIFDGVRYQHLYQDIDLRVYSSEQYFKYDFELAPNAQAQRIRLQYDGVDALRIDPQTGHLHIGTSVGELVEQQPYAYQIVAGKQQAVACQFRLLDSHTVGFYFPNGYNSQQALVIDPVLVGATLSGSSSTNYGHCATYDAQGNIYTGAISFGAGYSTNVGAFDTNFNGGGTDIAISKYTPDAANRLYGTYMGSNGGDYPHSLIVDYANQIHVLGSTDGANFPTTTGAFQSAFGGNTDIIVGILSTDGSSLVGATYMGGSGSDGRSTATSNYGDTYRGEIMIDQWGNTFVACGSQSSNFPVTAGTVQTTLNPAGGGWDGSPQDGVLFKLNPDLSELVFSTYLGGNGQDMAFGVRVAEDASLYVCGTAANANFPLGDNLGAQATFGGGSNDGFLLHLNASATQILSGTFRGTAGVDHAFFLDIDEATEKVLIYGQTDGNMPLVPADVYGQAGGDIFITAYDYQLGTIQYATALGNNGGLVPVAFMIDGCGYIYLSGYSGSGFPTTPNALYTSSAGSFYLGVLEPNAIGLNYGTYYTENHVDGGTSRFDRNGIVYQGVCSGGGFACTADAWATNQNAGWDIGVFKIDFQTPSVNAQAAAAPFSTGCAPFEVDFTNLGSSALEYLWFFGDGDSSILDEPSHLYTQPGTYDVLLIASDPTSCNIADTAFLQIIVLSNTTVLHDTSHCAANGALVLDVSLPISDVSYLWNNGSTLPTQSVSADGTYWVQSLYNNCTQTDSFVVDIVTPVFGLPPDTIICGSQYVVDVTHPDGTFYAWQDGSNSPIYTITQSGLYMVLATVQGCTVYDDMNVTLTNITDLQLPDVSVCDGTPISLDATIPEPNALYNWSNGSTAAIQNITLSGTYSVTITAGVCTDTDEISVTYGNIVIELGDDLALCNGETATLNATPTLPANGLSYNWNNGATTAIISPTQSGTYSVTVSSAEGCTAQDQLTLVVAQPLTPFSLGDDKTVCRGDYVLLTAPATAPNIIRAWQDGSSADTYLPTSSGTYWLELRTDCDTLRDEVQITIKDLPFIENPVAVPNAFSPNSDNRNDVFKPTVNGISGEYEFRVYDRWGQLVFETTDPAEGWNGTLQSTAGELGVYAWYCRAHVTDCEGEREIWQKGNVTLLR